MMTSEADMSIAAAQDIGEVTAILYVKLVAQNEMRDGLSAYH